MRRKNRNPLLFGAIAAILYFVIYQIIGKLFFTGFDFLVGGISAVVFGLAYSIAQFLSNRRR